MNLTTKCAHANKKIRPPLPPQKNKINKECVGRIQIINYPPPNSNTHIFFLHCSLFVDRLRFIRVEKFPRSFNVGRRVVLASPSSAAKAGKSVIPFRRLLPRCHRRHHRLASSRRRAVWRPSPSNFSESAGMTCASRPPHQTTALRESCFPTPL